MNPVYQITAQLDTLSSMASKWPPFGTKLGILPLAPKCTQHTKFQTIWTIGIDFGIWGIFVLVGKLLMHLPLMNRPNTSLSLNKLSFAPPSLDLSHPAACGQHSGPIPVPSFEIVSISCPWSFYCFSHYFDFLLKYVL